MSKTILITGANRGIGLELTRQYTANDWRGHACCREPKSSPDLQRVAVSAPGRITVHALDVTDTGVIAALAKSLSREPIDILLNNAGVYGSGDEAPGRLAAD